MAPNERRGSTRSRWQFAPLAAWRSGASTISSAAVLPLQRGRADRPDSTLRENALLYGPLLARYSDAWSLTRDPLFAEVVEETAAWTMREMQSAQGGYYSSLDADCSTRGKFTCGRRSRRARC